MILIILYIYIYIYMQHSLAYLLPNIWSKMEDWILYDIRYITAPSSLHNVQYYGILISLTDPHSHTPFSHSICLCVCLLFIWFSSDTIISKENFNNVTEFGINSLTDQELIYWTEKKIEQDNMTSTFHPPEEKYRGQ